MNLDKHSHDQLIYLASDSSFHSSTKGAAKHIAEMDHRDDWQQLIIQCGGRTVIELDYRANEIRIIDRENQKIVLIDITFLSRKIPELHHDLN